MFEGIDTLRLLSLTEREKRWYDNVRKAFHACDSVLKLRQQQAIQDRCLEELFKAIDTAKTLRRSLLDPNFSLKDAKKENRKHFIEFLSLEIPDATSDGQKIQLVEVETGQLKEFTLGEIIYLIRCMIHENENLNFEEAVDYHILLDWSAVNPQFFAWGGPSEFVLSGYWLVGRLREILAKFISGIEGIKAFVERRSFNLTCRPQLGSIRPDRQKRNFG